MSPDGFAQEPSSARLAERIDSGQAVLQRLGRDGRLATRIQIVRNWIADVVTHQRADNRIIEAGESQAELTEFFLARADVRKRKFIEDCDLPDDVRCLGERWQRTAKQAAVTALVTQVIQLMLETPDPEIYRLNHCWQVRQSFIDEYRHDCERASRAKMLLLARRSPRRVKRDDRSLHGKNRKQAKRRSLLPQSIGGVPGYAA